MKQNLSAPLAPLLSLAWGKEEGKRLVGSLPRAREIVV